MNHYVKINIPTSEFDYINGEGEESWAIVSEDVFLAYDADQEGTVYKAILNQKSQTYAELVEGTEILIELMGDYRPVIPYEWLIKNCGAKPD